MDIYSAQINSREFFRKKVYLEASGVVQDYGKESLFPTLYMLLATERGYMFDFTPINTVNIQRILRGHEDDIIAYMFVHLAYLYRQKPEYIIKMLKSGMNMLDIKDVDENVVMYYEDELLSVTKYYRVGYDVKSGNDIIEKSPYASVLFEPHSAMSNDALLLKIN